MNPTIIGQVFEIHAAVESLQGQLAEEGGEAAQEARLALSRIDGQLLEFLRLMEGVPSPSQPRRRGRRGKKPAELKDEDARQMGFPQEAPEGGASSIG